MMKRIPIIFFAVLLAACVHSNASQTIESVPEYKPEPLIVSNEHKKAFRLGANLLINHHYRKQKLSSLSADVYLDYLQSLDPSHIYFLQSDIDEFRNYGDILMQANKGDLSTLVNIYQRYSDRANALNHWSLERLSRPFDLDGNESITYPDTKIEKKQPWPQSIEVAQAKQEKRIEDQLIRLRVSGKSEEKAMKLLRSRYIGALRRLNQISMDDVFDIYMNVLSNRFDPHSNYLSPRTNEDFNINMRLSLEGIGAILGTEENRVIIRELVPGGPAYKSGKLNIKDEIIGIAQGTDGEFVDVVGWRLDKVVDLIRGKKGTLVRLLIDPANAAKGVREISLERDEVKLEEQAAQSTIETVTEEGITRRIGVIKLPSFYMDFEGAQQDKNDYRSTSRDVERLLKEFNDAKVDGVVIDLRSNGGGSLYEAVKTVGLFIDKGPVVLVSDTQGGVRTETDDIAGETYTGPMAVIIDRYAASASEIFAAAIQDYGRGLIIGSNSFGKGTVQTMVNLNDFVASNTPNLGAMKFTMAMFHRVNGSSTQFRGVTPDILLPSVFPQDEVGEQAEDYALPWKQIAAAKIKSAGKIEESTLNTLRQLHQTRMLGQPALRRYQDYIDKVLEKNKQKTWTLNLKERKNEHESWKKFQDDYEAAQRHDLPALNADKKNQTDIEQRNASIEDENDKESFVPDVALFESLNIFSDYLQLINPSTASSQHAE
ncbi:MAG: carboxy terminal-processing peptidase [Cardiobacteriaceae bacterium]|nr:carboxy terminal-processing peptidase [Cardiobacteriaceae bacterium]